MTELEELRLELTNQTKELERSHQETEFWYETALSLVQLLTRYPGITYTETTLRRCERLLTHPRSALDPAREAAKLLIDHYHQRMQRLQREAAELFCKGVGEKIREDVSTPRRYPLGVQITSVVAPEPTPRPDWSEP